MSISFTSLEDRRAAIESQRENSGRTAEVHGRFQTVGTGSIEFSTRLNFGVTFITEPCISYGAKLDADDVERVLEKYAADNSLSDDLKNLIVPDKGAPMFPMSSGFVTDWDQDHKGYYIGAWCGVRVDYPMLMLVSDSTPVYLQPQVEIIHSFRFSAVGLKNVPTQVTD